MKKILNLKSLSKLHRILGCPPPKHPYISFLKFSEMNFSQNFDFQVANTNFYIISFKTTNGKLKYGRDYYDFEEGTMIFTAPNQVMQPSHFEDKLHDENGWSLFIQPDIFYGSNLGNKIDEYTFFSYESNEALHLSDDEKMKILDCIKNIIDEYSLNIDQHTHNLIISNLELLFNYCKRFYDRQFYTRTKQNKDTIVILEKFLKEYFNSDKPNEFGVPTVKACAEEVCLSPNYLSDLLKKETGKNTKEYIYYYMLEKAKLMLLNSELSITEVAFNLGFEQPNSFSKLFKKKIGISPREYRQIN